MSFESDIAAFSAKLRQRTNDVFLNTVSAVHHSITDGSAVTGSPGQPVGQYGPGYHPGEVGGELKASWQIIPEAPMVRLIATNEPYARANEYGIRDDNGPYNQRSTVGGRHSVALTVAGFQRLVDIEVKLANP